MRVLVTVVDPRQDLRRDVVLQADDGATVADAVPELLKVARATSDNVVSISAAGLGVAGGANGVSTSSTAGHGAPTLYHLGERLDPTKPLADCGLREGSLLAVADPS